MNTLKTTGSLGLAGLVAAGLIAWQAPLAFADHGSDDRGRDDHGHHSKAAKRDDDAAVVVTTVDDDDDGDDTGLGHQTRTNTRGGDHAGDHTGTRTRGGNTDHSRSRSVRDLTNDGPGRHHVDHSRHHTNDGTRHNTRG
ncbi:hypothetical protein [Nocardioides conyzicola]|uniref:Uncharacterized protein n=1 Tax=Nocardioides conyzicola TaxID=1651781 RepID=A0ABP8XWR2_9ACTN